MLSKPDSCFIIERDCLSQAIRVKTGRKNGTAMTTKEEYFKQHFMRQLVKLHGYRQRSPKQFNPVLCMDEELLWEFLTQTQQTAIDRYARNRSLDDEAAIKDSILQGISAGIAQSKDLLGCLKHGVKASNVHFDLQYPYPSPRTPESEQRWNANIWFVTDEVHPALHNPDEIDLVVGVNGLPWGLDELKSCLAGEDYKVAQKQLIYERNHDDRPTWWYSPKMTNMLVAQPVYMERTRFSNYLTRDRAKDTQNVPATPIGMMGNTLPHTCGRPYWHPKTSPCSSTT